MLIWVLRLTFMLLATLIGLTSGHYFYDRIAPGLPSWFGGAIGFGVAITIIAIEYGVRRRFQRSIIAFQVGLALGLILSALVLYVMRAVLQNEELYDNLDLPVALVTTYLVVISVLANVDRWRVVIPFVEFRAEHVHGGPLVADAAALGDARLLGMVKAGLIPERLLIHGSVLESLESDARSEDAAVQARARRSLDATAELRAQLGISAEIDRTEVPNAGGGEDILVRLCRLEGARLVSGDRALMTRARAEGVACLDLHALASVFAPVVRPGEAISVLIERAGDGRGQGIGFLSDGSMVVVSNAHDLVGQTVQAVILRTHPTANGRMVFADLPPGPTSATAVTTASPGAPSH